MDNSKTLFSLNGREYIVSISIQDWYESDEVVELPSGEFIQPGEWLDFCPPILKTILVVNPVENAKKAIYADPQKQWEYVLETWGYDFENFICQVGYRQWETVDADEVQELLSEKEKDLLKLNGLHFTLPEGIGDAYDLRSQVQAKISDGIWRSI